LLLAAQHDKIAKLFNFEVLMEHITTYTGKDIEPLTPDPELIIIEDIAHALSLMCRANGHIKHFYSVAQHSINCAIEAKARGLSEKVQLACLLHDASEAYLSDITRPVKKHLEKYKKAEKNLQDIIYEKFLGSILNNDELAQVDRIDHDMLVCEFNHLMKKKVFDDSVNINKEISFEFRWFNEIERDFIATFNEIKTGGSTENKNKSLKEKIASIEDELNGKRKSDITDFIISHGIQDLLSENFLIKQLSSQVDVMIHAFGTLYALLNILEPDEIIIEMSLGAGNTGKQYDVATSKRLAEFKFANWNSSSNTIRQNTIFKDFVGLVRYDDIEKRKKYIYCLDHSHVIDFFENSGRNLQNVLSRNTIHQKHEDLWDSYSSVKEYFNKHKNEVGIVDLNKFLLAK